MFAINLKLHLVIKQNIWKFLKKTTYIPIYTVYNINTHICDCNPSFFSLVHVMKPVLWSLPVNVQLLSYIVANIQKWTYKCVSQNSTMTPCLCFFLMRNAMCQSQILVPSIIYLVCCSHWLRGFETNHGLGLFNWNQAFTVQQDFER